MSVGCYRFGRLRLGSNIEITRDQWPAKCRYARVDKAARPLITRLLRAGRPNPRNPVDSKHTSFCEAARLRPTVLASGVYQSFEKPVGLRFRYFRSYGARSRAFGVIGWAMCFSLSPSLSLFFYLALFFSYTWFPLPVPRDRTFERNLQRNRIACKDNPALLGHV